MQHTAAVIPFDPKGQDTYTFYRKDHDGRHYEKSYLQGGRVYDSSGMQRHHNIEALHRDGMAVTKEFRAKLRESELRGDLEEKLAKMKQEFEQSMRDWESNVQRELAAADAADKAQWAPALEQVEHERVTILGPKFNFEGIPTPRLDSLVPLAVQHPPAKSYFSDIKLEVPAYGRGAVSVPGSGPLARAIRTAEPANATADY